MNLFLAFAVAMTAMRVLICWIYNSTGSVLMAQFMHTSSTGSLVVFSASRVSAAQEVMWYSTYGASLWIVVAVVTKVCGKHLTQQIAWSFRRLKSLESLRIGHLPWQNELKGCRNGRNQSGE